MNKIVCLVVLILLMSAVPFSAFAVEGSNNAPNNIDVQVNAEADDGFVARSPELFRSDSTGIMIGTDLKFSSFLRFSNVTIPGNATITKAYITVVPIVTNPVGPRVNISVANDAHPSAPISSFDYYDRERTASYVNWNASLWHAGVSKNSTDISNVIQELVDSYDYSSGAPVLIFLDAVADGRNQCFAAYEHLHYAPAKLHIEYITEKEEEYKVHNINTGKSFSTIQAAIDNADTWDGHTITVDPGIYTENVNVAKSLAVKSTSGNPADTIVQAASSSSYIFNVTAADYVNISGFTVEGAIVGIFLDHAHYCNISDNVCENNTCSIDLNSSSSNILNNNLVLNGDVGISLACSSNNALTNNNVSNNSFFGILFALSNNSVFINNNVSNNYVGMVIGSSNNNMIYLNNFINNANNVLSSESTNTWSSPSKINYVYNGNTYTSNLGNYWDDYAGLDVNGDGIGDIPHYYFPPTEEVDNYPLTEPWEEYFAVSQSNLKITITSDKEEYSSGDTVNITTAFEVHATPEEPIIITNPITTTFTMDGELVFEDVSLGSERYTFIGETWLERSECHTIPEDAPEWYYDVTVSFSGGKYVKTEKDLFFVKADDVPGDVTGDGRADYKDLVGVIEHWGAIDIKYDVDRNGAVGYSDIVFILEHWTGSKPYGSAITCVQCPYVADELCLYVCPGSSFRVQITTDGTVEAAHISVTFPSELKIESINADPYDNFDFATYQNGTNWVDVIVAVANYRDPIEAPTLAEIGFTATEEGTYTINLSSVINGGCSITATFGPHEKHGVDAIAPTISNIKVSPTYALPGDSINISADVFDSSGISGVRAFISKGGEDVGTIFMSGPDEAGGIYTGTWSTMIFTEGGIYNITISATNTEGNEALKKAPGVEIPIDTEGPIVSDITVSPTSAEPGTPIHISAKVFDELSGVGWVEAIINKEGEYVTTVFMSDPDKDGIYTGTWHTTTSTGGGIYNINISATDNRGNEVLAKGPEIEIT